MAIHSQRHGGWVGGWVCVCVCVCVWGGAKGKTILFHGGGGGGFSFLLGPHAPLENYKTAGGEGYPVPQGGGGQGEYIMTSIIEVQEYMTG